MRVAKVQGPRRQVFVAGKNSRSGAVNSATSFPVKYSLAKGGNFRGATIYVLAVAGDVYFWVGTPKQWEKPSSSIRKNSVWPYSRSSSSETL